VPHAFRVRADRVAGRGEGIAVGLEHDGIEPAIEAEPREHGGGRLAWTDAVDGELRARSAQLAQALADGGVAPQLHPRVVVVEALELGAPVLDLVSRPLVELAPGDRAIVRELVGREGADGLETAGEVLDGGEPEGFAARREGILAEDDWGAHDEKATLSQTVPADRRSAVILTVGNELTSGDVENSNASWLARSLEALGCGVRLSASVPDDVEAIARFLRLHRDDADCVIVTGGLGGTPDDVTREGIAAAFESEVVLDEEAAAPLRERFAARGLTEYAERWATLPRGSEPLGNPLGGAPAFVLSEVYVLPGVPAEMRACFESISERFQGAPIRQARLRYSLVESDLVGAMVEFSERFGDVALGSYPSFDDGRREVELVLKSRDATRLREAVAWLESAVDAR
jgi:nicotinamide-nucleotide amidase